MTDPEWSDFRVVLALSRGGSVAGAARILGVDASTVSRRLAAIEKAMGAILIVRGGREFTFTAEGQAALRAAAAMDAAATAAIASVRASRADVDGTVRLSAFPSLTEFLTPFPRIVATRHPGLGVELWFSRGVVDLARGDADVAVRVNRDLPGDLIIRHTFDLGLALYASTAYLDAAGRLDLAEDLRRHRLVLFTEDFLSYPFAAWIEQFGDASPRTMRVDSVDMARSVIAADSGIGVLWCCHGDAVATLERALPEPISATHCCVVYHRSLRGSARVKAVVDLLVDHLLEHRDSLSGRRPGDREPAQETGSQRCGQP